MRGGRLELLIWEFVVLCFELSGVVKGGGIVDCGVDEG